ncbi:MAG TPA: hypothetical protein VFG47_11980 [Geminicoccaceae bacterium]|nr:hypothetical protein [Geminicoccaceae bacterium]
MAAAAELRALARVECDPRQRVRLPAIGNGRDGMAVDEAARVTGNGLHCPGGVVVVPDVNEGLRAADLGQLDRRPDLAVVGPVAPRTNTWLARTPKR